VVDVYVQEILVDILLREISKEEVAKITRSLLDKKAMGSELLGELKQAIDLEKIAVTRLWELLEQDSFKQLVRDLDL
jgi:hypothetical protein